MIGTPFGADFKPFLSPLSVPCLHPPFGTLSVVDLEQRKVLWSKPLGTAEDSGPFGIRSMLPFVMGVPNMGGSLNTKTGLVFIAATQETVLRAINIRNGEILWKARLPAGGQATPMTYVSKKSGRQFVVIAAGGSPVLGTKTGDYIVAFALPPKSHPNE
jgi:quinoprotein glucose dehydrogenase